MCVSYWDVLRNQNKPITEAKYGTFFMDHFEIGLWLELFCHKQSIYFGNYKCVDFTWKDSWPFVVFRWRFYSLLHLFVIGILIYAPEFIVFEICLCQDHLQWYIFGKFLTFSKDFWIVMRLISAALSGWIVDRVSKKFIKYQGYIHMLSYECDTLLICWVIDQLSPKAMSSDVPLRSFNLLTMKNLVWSIIQ